MSPDPGPVVVSCDGASRNNPGPAGIGAQLTTADGTVLAEIAEGIGETTNNVAEYEAAIAGLERALALGVTNVTLRSDSKLMVEQLLGRYRVKHPNLKPLHGRASALLARFTRVRIEHVRREFNTEADRLANEGVDSWLAAQ